MNRRILLLEPNYRNKYPPMGLMKLAMYHRLQGDDVRFYKGELSAFVLSEVVSDALNKLAQINSDVDWRQFTPDIQTFVGYGSVEPESQFERATFFPLIRKWLEHFRKYYRSGEYFEQPRWDRVCVTTLFTFYWDITIKTIEFAKKVCKDQKQVLVGGILASVVPKQVEAATEIRPHIGCLHVKKLLGDKPLAQTIDELPLDYSILNEIDYRYPATDAYYAYTTRGCINKCEFCAVPTLEPKYREYIPLKKRLERTTQRFGEQRHLLLLDNNVFASKKFDKIIDEIRDLGFAAGATFIPPNRLDIAIQQLRDGWNEYAAVRRAIVLLNEFLDKRNGEEYNRIYSLLMNNGLFHDFTASKEKILEIYEQVKDIYERARIKKPLARYVDFNQGLDSRLATDEKMKKLAEINIRPLRIAFDKWRLRQTYTRTVCLAKKHGILHASNYLLYNFKEKPVDLYRRLFLNVELSDVLEMDIYSFPMKYHPIMDKRYLSNRDYVGSQWTRKSIRTIQAVLNSTHGKIGRGKTFFFKAFGRNEEEFDELIQMPEAFIIKRWDAEFAGLTDEWRRAYQTLAVAEKSAVDKIVATMKFVPEQWADLSQATRAVLELHCIERESIPEAPPDEKKKLIASFEASCPMEISKECHRLLDKAGWL